MLRKGLIILGFGLFLLGVGLVGQGQEIPLGSALVDPTVQRSLDELRNLVLHGQIEDAEDLLEKIIQSSGTVKPLAEIYYRMAQRETDGARLAGYYDAMIRNWPKSAWAQKAANELIPLILMSGGQLGTEVIPLLWKEIDALLAPAQDASEIGEDPELLKNEVRINLLQLANSRQDAGRIEYLTNLPEKAPKKEMEQVDLARAMNFINTGQKEQAVLRLQDWLRLYPNSDFSPGAYLILYTLQSDRTQKQQIEDVFRSQYAMTLESVFFQSDLPQAGQGGVNKD